MTAYDARARTTAGRMLATVANGGKGQAVTLTRRAAGAYNPATSSAAISPSTQSGSGVEEAYRAFQIDGATVQIGDKKLHLSPLNSAGGAISAPEVDDTITLANGSVWTIKAVEELAPAGTVIMWTLQLRGAPTPAA